MNDCFWNDKTSMTNIKSHCEVYLAGECIGELVRFFSLRMSCILPPLLSHSTLRSSTFRFWWDEAESSLKLKAGKRKGEKLFNKTLKHTCNMQHSHLDTPQKLFCCIINYSEASVPTLPKELVFVRPSHREFLA